MPDYKPVLEELLKALLSLGKDSFMDYKKSAEEDITAFYKSCEKDLEHWITEYASGDIDQDDLSSLVKGQKELLSMEALTQKGIALSALQKFRDDAVDLVLDTIIARVI
jgi:hypothetical protein